VAIHDGEIFTLTSNISFLFQLYVLINKCSFGEYIAEPSTVLFWLFIWKQPLLICIDLVVTQSVCVLMNQRKTSLSGQDDLIVIKRSIDNQHTLTWRSMIVLYTNIDQTLVNLLHALFNCVK